MEGKSRALLKTTAIYTVGNFGSKVLSFGLVPIFSYYLTKEDFGYYDLIMTIVSLSVPLITLQLTDSILRWLLTSESNEDIIVDIISNSYFVVLFNILIIAVLTFLGFLFFDIPNIGLIALMLVTSVFYPVLQQTIRGLGMNKLFAINGLTFSVLYLISNVVFLIIFGLGIQALFISSILSNLICILIILYRFNPFSYFKAKRINKEYILELLQYSFPLLPNTISWWLISSANKFIILYFLTIGDNGIYGMANRFPAIMIMVNSIFIMAWQESAILNYNKEDSTTFFSSILKKLFIIQCTFGTVLILSSNFIIDTFIDPEYYSAWKIMPVLFISVILTTISGFYGSIYLGAKKTKGIFKTTLISGLINLIIAVILIQFFGLIGVAIGTCTGFLSLILIRYFDTKKFMKIEYCKRTFFTYSTLILISTIISYLNIGYLTLFTFFLILTILIILNKSNITFIFLQLKNRIK